MKVPAPSFPQPGRASPFLLQEEGRPLWGAPGAETLLAFREEAGGGGGEQSGASRRELLPPGTGTEFVCTSLKPGDESRAHMAAFDSLLPGPSQLQPGQAPSFAAPQGGVSREVPCSALKGETVADSLPATPKSPPTRRVPPRGPLRPLRGLQETRVATREESGVLGFPSRRGLTPRGSQECNPEIPAFPGEEY